MKKSSGFTLIELMMVICIVGIVIAIFFGAGGLTNSTISWGVGGTVETRCINGYLTNVTPHSTETLRDDDNRRIPCNSQFNR